MSAQHERGKVPILMYHSISQCTNRKFKRFTVSPALFAEQMAYLHQHGYVPITVTQLVNGMAQNCFTLPERPVVLTFDDGYADFFTEALPILKQFGFVATLYVVTGFVNGTSCWLQREGETTRPMITWNQLVEISQYGIECGAHTQHHPQLDIVSHASAQDEIVQSKKLLEQHLKHEVLSFAYPYGYHTAFLGQQVKDAGYTSACIVNNKLSTEKWDPFALARLTIKSNTNVEHMASLLIEQNSSFASSLYMSAKASLWQFARFSTASVKHYLSGGLVTQ